MNNKLEKLNALFLAGRAARSEQPLRWQTYFVWAAIFITGVVVGATFF
jgi:hypothetical protein